MHHWLQAGNLVYTHTIILIYKHHNETITYCNSYSRNVGDELETLK